MWKQFDKFKDKKFNKITKKEFKKILTNIENEVKNGK